MNYLPSKLLKLRKHYNYSQQYLAEVLDIETLDYMAYENGKNVINYEQMKTLASLYHIGIVDMFKNSDDVPLYEIDKANTDEINIAYFTREKNIFEKVVDFISEHKIVTGIIAGLILIVAVLSSILGNNSNQPHIVQKDDINRLSASETTVVYINNNGTVKYNGDNSNGQTFADSSIAVKVAEGEGFTVILNEDGTIVSSGIEEYEKDLSSWTNIKDIAVGSNHVVAVDSSGKVYCTGDNTFGQCDIAGTRNIEKVFATANGSIVVNKDGKVECSGKFVGSSNIRSYTNIVDIDSSDELLAILKNDGTLTVIANDASYYLEAEGWTDIIDVTCGKDFVAALDSFHRVHIEINNDRIREKVSEWTDIIAIDAGNNYLVAFDGTYIYGEGKSLYGQFAASEVEKIELPQVSEVNVENYDEGHIKVEFLPVDYASGYTIEVNVETGILVHLDENEPTFAIIPTKNMIDGHQYTISIVANGRLNYKDSEKYKYKYTYEKMKEETPGEQNGQE